MVRGTAVAVGVGVGEGVNVGEGVTVGDGVIVGVAVGVNVAEGVRVAVRGTAVFGPTIGPATGSALLQAISPIKSRTKPITRQFIMLF